jgi:dihydroorotate dehydrogenase
MPDWSYQTILRPMLFRLPPESARDLSLWAMGTLARSPVGSLVIDFMGHMRPDPRLGRGRMGLRFPSAVGLGAGIDAVGIATPALARFGFGYLELGPVTARPWRQGLVERWREREEIDAPGTLNNPGAQALADRLGRDGRARVPVFARLAALPGSSDSEIVSDFRDMARVLASRVQALTLMLPPGEGDCTPSFLVEVISAVKSSAPELSLLLVVPADLASVADELWVRSARALGVVGIVIDGGLREDTGRRRFGPESAVPARSLVGRLRALWPEATLIASGGVHRPLDALQLLDAGADFVQIDSGLVYAGPGLPKRINDAVLAWEHGGEPALERRPAPKMTWFWALLMGLGMLIGSLMALGIASTRVVLPYDEQFAGLNRSELAAINPHLLRFMTHDRVSLAGVMTSLGVLYCGLSWFGIRRGLHWAMVSVLTSAFIGFLSFFLFLGFGYLDPLHAFVTVVLLQFLVMAVHADLGTADVPARPSLFNDRTWRLSLWGQLLVIVQATLFVLAGLVISVVGVTRVFVPEDLAFLHTTTEALAHAGPRLIPLVAHDRASLGGMLICSGLGFLMPTLWGYRRGERWLWWTLALAAVPGFLATSVVHLAVGYHDWKHLAPVFLGAVLMSAGLAFSYPYLCWGDTVTDETWARLRSGASNRAAHRV